MSGIKRAILSELAAKGTTGKKSQEALSVRGQLEEKGYGLSKDKNDDSYLGRNAKPATKGK